MREQAIELSVLGGVALRRDGDLVTGRPAQRHHVALLAFLAASRGGPVSREKLVGHLWPEHDSVRARHRLSVAIHVLRRGLGEECLTTPGDVVCLNRDIVWTDVGAFSEAVEGGRLEEAVSLYAGPFLDGFFLPDAVEYEPWMESERDRLAGVYRAALERLIAEAQQRGGEQAAVQWWRRLAVHDRYSASVALGLMRALAANGDAAGAIRYARAYATLVEGDLELPPSEDVLELAEELVREGRANGRDRAQAEPPVEALEAEADSSTASRAPHVRPERSPTRAFDRDDGAGTYLRLARRLAGWAAVAVLLTILAAGILSLRPRADSTEASPPAVGVMPSMDD
jgi:DNA-binding SARP family transcriptional activator